MRKNWRYGKLNWQLANGNMQEIANCLLSTVYCLLLIAYCLLTSCGNKKHEPTSAEQATNLNELAQPVNQTIFSDVKAIVPIQQSVTPILKATGIISYDPRLINNISARYSGRIEKLYVRFNFQSVSKGQRIMDIYSPEILTEQQNLIFLLSNSPNDTTLIKSSKQKLQLLGLTTAQLSQVESTKQPLNPLPVYSQYDGHIHDIGISGGISSSSSSGMSGMSSSLQATSPMQIENLPSSQTAALSIKEGMYVQSGQPVFAIYNTSQVWAVLNIFQKDAALIKEGDKVSIKAETNPDQTIEAAINYIEPVTGQNASTIKARVYLKNAENLHLKIGTLLSAEITSAPVDGLWLPRSAIVNLGKTQVVFLKSENFYTTQEIQTGIETDTLVQVLSGLQGNEQIAQNAQYLVDSESFIKTQSNGQ